MADNTAVTNGAGDVYRSKDRAGVKTDIVGIDVGIGGTEALMSAANPMPVYMPDVVASGSLTAAAQTVTLALNGDSGIAVQVTGTWVGTLTFEATVDGSTWQSVNGVGAATAIPSPTTTVNGLYRLTPSGCASVRVNMTAFTSGTAVVSMRGSDGTGGVFANQVLPMQGTGTAGTPAGNVLSVQGVASGTPQPVSGTVTANAGTGTLAVSLATAPTTPVTGTFFQGTQPVSLATNTPTLAAGTNTIGAVNIAQAAGTAGLTQPALAITSFTVLAANASRKGAVLFNDSANVVYLAYAATATTTAYTMQLDPNGGRYELPAPVYSGIITGIALAATGNLRVTEIL